MKYIKVKWLTASPADPVWLYFELNDGRREIRKIEVYRNGTVGWADPSHEDGLTRLGELPVPSLNEINAQPDFEAVEITPQEFESAWISLRDSS